MSNPRVAITGIGVICSAGADIPAFAENVAKGICSLSAITEPVAGHFNARFAGIVRTIPDSGYLAGFNPDFPLDRYLILSIYAAYQATTDAGYSSGSHPKKAGILFATCSGPMLTIENHYMSGPVASLGQNEASWFSRRYFSAARILGHLLKIDGVNMTVTTACSASVNALGLAADMVRCGELDMVLVGGADSLSYSTLAGFDGVKATSPAVCAPFSKPAGMNLGEGAGFVVVEPLDQAQKRRHRVHAEILGYGISNDAYHVTAPDPSGKGQALAMQRALANASLSAADIGYVNAHGTGTEANDRAEVKAIKRIFNTETGVPPMSSLKGVFGHCLGAAGILETIGTIVSAEKGVLAPTPNFNGPREGCDIDCVPVSGRPWSGKPFLNNNFAFGGNNASMALCIGAGERVDIKENNPDDIVITSLGIVSTFGVGTAAFREGVVAGLRPALSTINCSFGPSTAALLSSFDPRTVDRRLDLRGFDRASQFAAAAAWLALMESGLHRKQSERTELGFYYHCGHGPVWAEAEHISTLQKNAFHITQLTAFPYIVPNSVAGNVCRALGLSGPNVTCCLGPGAGFLGLGPALSALQSGQTQIALSGSADEVSEANLADIITAFSSTGDAPATPAEGSVMMLLETATHARARSAVPLARIAGFCQTTDTTDVRRPDPGIETALKAVQSALKKAGIGPADLSAVCLNRSNKRETALMSALLPGWQEKLRSVPQSAGFGETTAALLDLSYAILSASIEKKGPSYYILGLLCSPNGYNGACVIQA